MEQTQRQYGPNGSASLADIHQADVTDVVTALHHIPNGGVWSVEEIFKRKVVVEDADLVWSVVGSIPIHEDIKTHTGNYEQWVANYQQTLHSLAQCGTRTVCYSFMPVLGWTRADLEYVLPDDSKALRFDQIEFAAFEMHTLKRPGAEADYTEEEITQAAKRFATMSDEDKARLTRSIITSLPGTEKEYILDQFRKRPELYKDIGKAKLHKNFAIFLKAIIPVAEEVDMRIAVYPDGPPRPIFGLPRIVPTVEDIQWMVDTVNSMADGFTTCTGSYSVHADNNLVDMVKQLGLCIYLTHLRSTVREDNPKTFHEAAHLNGDVNVCGVMKAIVKEEHRRKTEGKEDLIPIRSNHGHQILGDLRKKTNPDYFAIDRLKGSTEVRGVELAIRRALFSH